MNRYFLAIVALILLNCSKPETASQKPSTTKKSGLKEVNHEMISVGNHTLAVVGVNLINGIDSEPLANQTVIIRENMIASVGHQDEEPVPSDAVVIEGDGLTLLPGLIDSHFHLNNDQLPNLMLRRGVTSVRDPGAWIESYDQVRKSRLPAPRLFLTGPHLDQSPPAYPKNSYLIRDQVEARYAVNRFADQGASAIKVYFRLPPVIIREVCAIARKRGMPVVAHLEITRATDAIKAGVDGIEHVTSFGSDLLPVYEAEQYIQSIMANNSARREGRYQVWNAIDLHHQRVDSMIAFLKQRGTVVSPTLGAFEYRFGENKQDTLKVQAFANMLAFTGMVHKAGVPVVVGSHSWVPYQREVGWAFQREMELLAESGLTNMEVIKAATIENARYFRVEDRLGTVEAGKQADLILVSGDPSQDLASMYDLQRVMVNGVWVER